MAGSPDDVLALAYHTSFVPSHLHYELLDVFLSHLCDWQLDAGFSRSEASTRATLALASLRGLTLLMTMLDLSAGRLSRLSSTISCQWQNIFKWSEYFCEHLADIPNDHPHHVTHSLLYPACVLLSNIGEHYYQCADCYGSMLDLVIKVWKRVDVASGDTQAAMLLCLCVAIDWYAEFMRNKLRDSPLDSFYGPDSTAGFALWNLRIIRKNKSAYSWVDIRNHTDIAVFFMLRRPEYGP